MGRLWDKLTGTKRPDSGLAPLPSTEVRAALLALNGPDVSYRVRNALPSEKADLVAECRVPRVGVTLKTQMRLIPEKHEVRFLDERWENRSSGNANEQYGRGHAPAVFRQWETKEDPDGRRRRVEAFRFDTREMTDPLRNAVLDAGWTCRGVLKL
ncbi:hypothetical protein [Streptomyces chartreusis]|uniref:hypothetical protein n=1 Tax=Streptomyces chartreusis TaxID=1969 RepID=UPI002E82055E|nr:hypothetical protein [Streptomyces chartreusis]WUB18355.1 hypothetical protein OG997_17220 [Streptomyces chartreusis]